MSELQELLIQARNIALERYNPDIDFIDRLDKQLEKYNPNRLTHTEKTIVDVIKKNPGLRTSDVLEHLNHTSITYASLRVFLSRLKQKGVLEKYAYGNSGRWFVANKEGEQ